MGAGRGLKTCSTECSKIRMSSSLALSNKSQNIYLSFLDLHNVVWYLCRVLHVNVTYSILEIERTQIDCISCKKCGTDLGFQLVCNSKPCYDILS